MNITPGLPSTHIAQNDASPTPASLQNPAVARQLYSETGLAIRQQKSEVKWTGARNVLQRIASRASQDLGLRSGADQMNRFIEHVVVAPNAHRTIAPDPVDTGFQVFAVPVGDKTARLSVDASGRHVNAFPHLMAKHPVLGEAVTELKNMGWTLQYGTAHALSRPDKTLTIDAAGMDAEPLMDLLSQLPLRSVGKALAGRVAQYIFDHAGQISGGNVCTTSLASLEAYGLRRTDPQGTFYDAVNRRIVSPQERHAKSARFDPTELPGVTAHDATMVMAYRLLSLPLNIALRDRSAPGLALLKESGIEGFVKGFNASLAAFPRFAGPVYREVDDLPAAAIARYAAQTGNVIQEPWPVSTTDRRFGYAEGHSDVKFLIQSASGRSLKGLSPYSEVMFAAGSAFRTDSVTYEPGTQQRAFPKATIVQTQVDAAAAGGSV